MAELSTAPATRTGVQLSRGQFAAIGWLRWRIFCNSFRRKGGVGELIGRLLLFPFLAFLALTPSLLAGFLAWSVARGNSLSHTIPIFWGAFALAQLVNINLGQPGTTFDPVELIRFPLALRNYVLVRLAFGLLSPGNLVVALISAAIFIGVTIARPQLWPWALAATFAFALCNVLFTRMIFAWVDRWLSTRRAREIFTGLIFAGSLGFQYLNVTYNPGFAHPGHHRRHAQASGDQDSQDTQQTAAAEKLHRAQQLYARAEPWLRWLPPELAGTALTDAAAGQYLASVLNSGGVLLYSLLFLGVYTARMRTEYLGENLSDAANAVSSPAVPPHDASHAVHPSPVFTHSPANDIQARRSRLPPTLKPMLAKELLLLRRNTGLLYGLVAPTVMVFLFAGRLSLRGDSHWLLPIAIAYALLGLAPMSYNSFGLEGTGAQLYFIAPVPLRDVFLAKNCMQFLLAIAEVSIIIAIISYVVGAPHPGDAVFGMFWAAGALLLNTTLGNLRSISAPKKVNPGRSINRNQSQLSVWISLGVLAGTAALGAGFLLLGTLLHRPWISMALAALFAMGGLLAYSQGLQGIERYALERRETLFEELGKKA